MQGAREVICQKDRLFQIETAGGLCQPSPRDSGFEERMNLAEDVMHRYCDALRALAKRRRLVRGPGPIAVSSGAFAQSLRANSIERKLR
jgi:hypothetical protein